jgi:hypothetical protein
MRELTGKCLIELIESIVLDVGQELLAPDY